MGPIIASITGHGDQAKKPPPKSFIELIATLDEVSKNIIKGGSLITMNESRAELAVMKTECNNLKI